MAIILVILLSLLSFQLMGCTLAANRSINIPGDLQVKAIEGYPLLDNRGILHKYRDNFKSIIFPTHNKKLTQYCGTHFQWEVIKSVWKRKDDDNYSWHYIVRRSKKQ